MFVVQVLEILLCLLLNSRSEEEKNELIRLIIDIGVGTRPSSSLSEDLYREILNRQGTYFTEELNKILSSLASTPPLDKKLKILISWHLSKRLPELTADDCLKFCLIFRKYIDLESRLAQGTFDQREKEALNQSFDKLNLTVTILEYQFQSNNNKKALAELCAKKIILRLHPVFFSSIKKISNNDNPECINEILSRFYEAVSRRELIKRFDPLIGQGSIINQLWRVLQEFTSDYFERNKTHNKHFIQLQDFQEIENILATVDSLEVSRANIVNSNLRKRNIFLDKEPFSGKNITWRDVFDTMIDCECNKSESARRLGINENTFKSTWRRNLKQIKFFFKFVKTKP